MDKQERAIEVLSKIDDDIIEEHTKTRFELMGKRSGSSGSGSRKRNIKLLVTVAASILLVVAAVMIAMLMPMSDNSITVLKTGTDGNKDVYTVTYENGSTSVFTVANIGGNDSIENVTVNESGEFILKFAGGGSVNIGNSIGVMTEGDTADNSIRDVELSKDGELQISLASDKTLNLGHMHQHKGDKGLSKAYINESGELILGFADGSEINLGRVVGEKGEDGVGIAGIYMTEAGELVVNLTNGTEINLGNIKGKDGIGISESKINEKGELVITYTDGRSINLGKVVGERGADGVGISNITLSEDSELVITLTDGAVMSLGSIRGENGKSAYELFKDKYGYEGTEEDWLYDLANGNLAEKIVYTVSFNTNCSLTLPDQVIATGGKVERPELEREGYELVGWYIDGEKWNFAGHTVTDDITLEAVFRICEYSLTYNLAGGTLPSGYTAEYTVESESFTLKNPTRRGYTFTGWTYEGQSEPEISVTVEKGSLGNLTFNANWTAVSYTITYNSSVGSIPDGAPTSYTIEDRVVIPDLQAPTTERYSFDGWNMNGTFVGRGLVIEAGTVGNITLSAEWTYTGHWWAGVKYDETSLTVSTTRAEYVGMWSSAERLMAGDEGASKGKTLDELVAERNSNAAFNTKVAITYHYYPSDSSRYGWTNVPDIIYAEVSNGDGCDIYTNFTSSMLTASLKGAFANILSESRDSAGAGTVTNFFTQNSDFDNFKGLEAEGYMKELMSSLTLSETKKYVIMSDFFIDGLRGMYFIPVNLSMINLLAHTVTADRDLDNDIDIYDVYAAIKSGEWTYSMFLQLSGSAYWDGGDGPGEDVNDRMGFMINGSSASAAMALLYSTNMSFIESTPEGTEPYSYPEYSSDMSLQKVMSKIRFIFSAQGQMALTDYDADATILSKFTADELLFGGIVPLASLEGSDYKSLSGYGIVPVPLYQAGDSFNTQLHSGAQAGGISAASAKFTQCTAFIQYQTEHSGEIVEAYYAELFENQSEELATANAEMLAFLRDNIGSGRDKHYDDAICMLNGSLSDRWHMQILNSSYAPNLTEDTYNEKIGAKQTQLSYIIATYSSLPD